METVVINKSRTTTISELKPMDIFIFEGRINELGLCLYFGNLDYFSFEKNRISKASPSCRVVIVKKIHKIEIEL